MISFANVIARIATVSDAVELLKISDTSVKELCATNELPAVRLGRAWLIDAHALAKMAKRRDN